MVKNHYECDQCEIKIPTKEYALQLNMNTGSGYGAQTGLIKENMANSSPRVLALKTAKDKPIGIIYHFCSGECIGDFFTGALKYTISEVLEQKVEELKK